MVCNKASGRNLLDFGQSCVFFLSEKVHDWAKLERVIINHTLVVLVYKTKSTELLILGVERLSLGYP